MLVTDVARGSASSGAAGAGAGRAVQGFTWLLLYVLVAVTPLVIALSANRPPARDFWLETSVGLGFVGLSMMGLQFAVVGRFSAINAPFGLDAVLQYHRSISFVALAFILAHPVIIVIRRPELLELLNPITATWNARFGLMSLWGLVLLIATSVWRKRLRLPYEWWRLLHGVLAVVIVVTALVHIGRVGYYVDGAVKRGLWILMSVVFVGLLVNIRVITPIRLLRRPWKVVSVEPERGGVWSLTIAPDGHDGIRFLPGQFGWIRVDRSPFSLLENPFSFSSSADRTDAVEFGIAEAGDFTSTLGTIAPGTRVHLDGPYGVFSYERNEGPAFVFIAGGIGISPILSMLRTMADRGDRRPVLLIYANPSWDEVAFRDELDTLCGRLDLQVVHVVETDDGLPAARERFDVGFVDADVLDRRLPAALGGGWRRARYFICGPPPMMDAVLPLLIERGVPGAYVDHERFDII